MSSGPITPTAEEKSRRVEELWVAVHEYQRRRVSRGQLPDRRKLILNRTRWLFELAGGVLLALNVAVGTLLVNFIIFNMLLHATFD